MLERDLLCALTPPLNMSEMSFRWLVIFETAAIMVDVDRLSCNDSFGNAVVIYDGVVVVRLGRNDVIAIVSWWFI